MKLQRLLKPALGKYRWFSRSSLAYQAEPAADSVALLDLTQHLLKIGRDAPANKIADAFFERYEAAKPSDRAALLCALGETLGPDLSELAVAARDFLEAPSIAAAQRLHMLSGSRRIDVIKQLNQARNGTARLLRLRADLLEIKDQTPAIMALDLDFVQLFTSWFNPGFLILTRLDWATPAIVLERLVKYEAVHDLLGLDDLQRRIEPADRQCYAFFHPQIPLDPLIFVEVALLQDVPTSIASLLAAEREVVPPHLATTAAFYSISNCQTGLKGIAFGGHLIKRVVELLRKDFPALRDFVTLSPMPGFRQWREQSQLPALSLHSDAGPNNGRISDIASEQLRRDASRYLLQTKDRQGRPLDPVARFHLGNGAELAGICLDANQTPKGIAQSYGVMVNYRYDIDHLRVD
ncbi:MAG TPA: malonyl-CoA decarboxylase family protein [Dongiaceae bacterium]